MAASKREQVVTAVKALIAAALPMAEVTRNPAKAERIAPGGSVIVRDGDPGEPEVDLSPLTYNYTHRIPLEIAAYESASKSREEVLDDLLTRIGAAVAANRTLGGLCQFLEAEAPNSDDLDAAGALAGRWAEAVIVASYAASSPLN